MALLRFDKSGVAVRWEARYAGSAKRIYRPTRMQQAAAKENIRSGDRNSIGIWSLPVRVPFAPATWLHQNHNTMLRNFAGGRSLILRRGLLVVKGRVLTAIGLVVAVA